MRRLASTLTVLLAALLGVAFAGELNTSAPKSTHGGACTLGQAQEIAAAEEPWVPNGVSIALAADRGAIAWMPKKDRRPWVQRVGPRGEPVASKPVRLEAPIKSVIAFTPDRAGYLLVGVGGAAPCSGDCVVAQALDTSGAPVGGPAVWAPGEPLDATLPPATVGSDGVTTLVALYTSHQAVEVRATRGTDGAAVVKATPIPDSNTVPSKTVLVEDAGERVALLSADGKNVALWRGGVLHPAVPVDDRPVTLTHGPDGWSAWFPKSVDATGNKRPAYRRVVAANGTLGPPIVEAPPAIVVGRVDTGVTQDAQNQKLSGLLFTRRSLIETGELPPVLMQQATELQMARTVVAAPDAWVAAWIADAGGGWKLYTRAARCPAGASD